MSQVPLIRTLLQNSVTLSQEKASLFFKTGPGHYGHHDRFMGVTVPTLRHIAKKFHSINLCDIEQLLTSSFNEERFLALILLVARYEKAKPPQQEKIYEFYLNHRKHVNNWNLVDGSAHWIMGAYLWNKDKNILFSFAHSAILWERRIAIVSTWYFIRQNSFDCTLKLSEILLNDTHDLIHKAVGWMLREVGKRDVPLLTTFLDRHKRQMPRTMLRYAIEKFPKPTRKAFLATDNGQKKTENNHKNTKHF